MIPDLRPFLEEDVGAGDITTQVFVPDIVGTATIICEQDAVIAGLEEAQRIFELLGVDTRPLCIDGDRVVAGTIIMLISGPLKGIMTGERVALNFLMRMSGISTATNNIVRIVRLKDPCLKVAATRKTTPGFRFFEKKAVTLGGGWPHRYCLDDMVLIKDNHIVACGGIREAMDRAGSVPDGIKIEIEVQTIWDGITAAECGADIILADHMSPTKTKELRDAVKQISPKTEIEASGNITPDMVPDYAGCADIVSLGSLTHSVKAMHFSLDIDEKKH